MEQKENLTSQGTKSQKEESKIENPASQYQESQGNTPEKDKEINENKPSQESISQSERRQLNQAQLIPSSTVKKSSSKEETEYQEKSDFNYSFNENDSSFLNQQLNIRNQRRKSIIVYSVPDLFDRLIGTSNFDPKTNYLITEKGIVENIVILLKLCNEQDEASQLYILESLLQIFSKSTRNIYLCKDLNLINILIEMIPTIPEKLLLTLLQLIKTLSKFSISVYEVKNLFSVLSHPLIEHEKKELILQFIQHICAFRCPNFFFDFDGDSSAIKLPPLDKWPTSSYAISIWFCIESFENPQNVKNNLSYEPRLFSFLTNQAMGLEAFFSNKTLFLRTNQQHQLALRYKFDPGKWYHLIILHSYTKLEWLSLASSGLKIYVNGRLEEQTTLKYPETSQAISTCYLGSSASIKSTTFTIPEETSFYGQIGMFILFSESLTNSQILELFQLGFNYFPSFRNKDLLTRHGAPKIHYAFSPQACKGDVCFNLGNYQKLLDIPHVFSLIKQTPQIAQISCTTKIISRMQIQDSLYCGSGIQIILPMFQFLNQEKVLSPSTINLLISLLRNFLFDHPGNQLEMVQSNGYRVLGYLLQQLSGQLDTTAVSLIENLLASINNASEAIHHLLLNFDIWIRTTFAIQKQVCSILAKTASENIQFFRNEFGVQKFLDVLRNYYWYIKDPQDIRQIEIYKTVNRSVTGFEDLREIRKDILLILETLIRGSEIIEANEVEAFVLFFQECVDGYQLVDVLLLLFKLLIEKPVKNLVHHLEALGGTKPFFELIYKQNDQVREAATKVIGALIQHMSPKQKSKFLLDNALYFYTDAPLTEAYYYSLVEIILEMFSIDKHRLDTSKLIGENRVFHNPQIIAPLFKMVIRCEEFSLVQKIISEFNICMHQNNSTYDSFLDQFGWQTWMLELISYSNSAMSKFSEAERESVQELTLNLFSRLVQQKLLRKEGYKIVEETETFIQMYGAKQSIDPVRFQRSLYLQVLDFLEGDLIKSEPSKHNPIWKNFVHLVYRISEFVFFPKFPRAEDERPWDHDLVCKVLNSFDYSIRPVNAHLMDIEGVPQDIFTVVLRLSLMMFQESYGHFYPNTSFSDEGPPIVSTGPPQTNDDLAKLFYNNVQRVRQLVTQVVPRGNIENVKKVCWILHYLFKAIKRSKKLNDTAHKILLPLVKEILRNHQVALREYLGSDVSFEYSEEAVQESASYHDFMHYYNKTFDWNFALLEKISSCRKEFEEDINYPERIQAKREKSLSALQKQVSREITIEFTNRSKMQHDCFSLNLRQRAIEVERRALVGFIYLDLQRSIERIWKKMYRQLVNQRTCWRRLDKGKLYYKLDDRENMYRMRKRLKRNWHGTDHRKARYNSTNNPNLSSEPPIKIANANDATDIPTNNENNLAISESGENVNESSEASTLFNSESNSLNTSKEDEVELFLRTLSGINIHVNKDDFTFEFEGTENLDSLGENELMQEESWCVMDESDDTNRIRVSEKILLAQPCLLVNALTASEGKIVIGEKNLHFLFNRTLGRFSKDKKWPLEDVVDVQKRRYLLRNNALEIFLKSNKSYLFNFEKNVRPKVMKVLYKVCPGNVESHSASPKDLLRKSGLTQKWQRHEISNFEYLMHLNTFAGRTYNDLTQYPVFPWVLQDYESPELDLSNPQVYRDLSKPVGALNPERLKRFQERYEAFDDPNIPKFHYGTHYSSIGSVLFFLLRVEPFATNFVENLQGGRWDVADRMFHSIGNAWKNCLISPSDVKELIPELFYFPEFATNANGFDFGVKQDGEVVNDVVLPSWSKTPADFIRVHREALESEYVSKHLHEWIDLIFGYKQRGEEAEKANNVFYYLTYEGAVNIDEVKDPVERKAIESQIQNFGQTPSQLFHTPHPKRDPLPSTPWLFNSPNQLKISVLQQSPFPVAHLALTPDEIMIVSENVETSVSKWAYMPEKLQGENSGPFAIVETNSTSITNWLQDHVCAPLLTFPGDTNSLIACSRWNFSILVFDGNKISQVVRHHRAKINCFAVSSDGKLLVAGSADGTASVWKCINKGKSVKIHKKPLLLRGHDDEVTAVAINQDLDICVTGSKDATINIHSLHQARFIRSFRHPNRCVVHKILVSNQGDILIYSSGDNALHLFSINGAFLCSKNTDDLVNCIRITSNSKYAITAGGKLIIRKLYNLEPVYSYNLSSNGSITSMELSKNEQLLVAALTDNKLIAFTEK